jgi:hypothetical protein
MPIEWVAALIVLSAVRVGPRPVDRMDGARPVDLPEMAGEPYAYTTPQTTWRLDHGLHTIAEQRNAQRRRITAVPAGGAR